MRTIKEVINSGGRSYGSRVLEAAQCVQDLSVTYEQYKSVLDLEKLRIRVPFKGRDRRVFLGAVWDYALGKKGLEEKADEFKERRKKGSNTYRKLRRDSIL